jgi:hypothetical protein
MRGKMGKREEGFPLFPLEGVPNWYLFGHPLKKEQMGSPEKLVSPIPKM